MNRIFKPSQKLDAANSKIIGIRIKNNGNIEHIRVRVMPATNPVEIVTGRELLNRISDYFPVSQ